MPSIDQLRELRFLADSSLLNALFAIGLQLETSRRQQSEVASSCKLQIDPAMYRCNCSKKICVLRTDSQRMVLSQVPVGRKQSQSRDVDASEHCICLLDAARAFRQPQTLCIRSGHRGSLGKQMSVSTEQNSVSLFPRSRAPLVTRLD